VDGLDLGGKQELVPVERVMQGLLPEAIARNQQFMLPLIVQSESKHPPQLLHALTAHFLIQMDDDFGIGVGREAMTTAQQLGAQLGEVINFPVEHYPDRMVFIEYGLMPAGQIDDAEATHPKPNAAFDKNAFVIRATMKNGLAHAANRGRFNSSA
jgi:hypothetical protein